MKINELVEGELDNFDLTPQQREIVALGHVLKTQAATVKDDALSNAMARVGDELTSFGATFGPKNAKDVEKKSGVPMPVIKKLMAFAKKIQSEQDSLKKDHTDGGLDDTNDTDDDYGSAAKADAFAKDKMGEGEKRDTHCSDKCCGSDTLAEDCKCPPTCKHCNCNKPNIAETTSAGAVAAVAAPIGGMMSRQKKNADGTAKNALDQDNILSNGKSKKASRNRSK